MSAVDGTLARSFDFGQLSDRPEVAAGGRRSSLRLASARKLSGPGKYKVLEARRRQAQRQARHLLDMLDAAEEAR